MIGNSNINYDTEKVYYDLNISIPFVGQFVLTKQHIDTALKYLEDTKKELTTLTTTQLDGIRMREVPFSELPQVIEHVETLLADLKDIEEKSKNKPNS